jgi:hypothetical protein
VATTCSSPRARHCVSAEAYRLGARGESRVLPARWIAASWTPRTRSRFTGHHYGYGWFIAQARGHPRGATAGR